MNIESIKDFFRNIYEALYYKIKDSALFNILLEKYENLDTHHQLWIYRISICIIFAFVFLIPVLFLISSINRTQEFQTKKKLIYELLQSPSETISNRLFSANELRSRILNSIPISDKENYIKIQPISKFNQLPKSLKKLNYSGTKITIQNLNIQEAIEIGQKLDHISTSIKLLQFQVKELKDKKNYFQGTYSIIQFQPPTTPSKKRIVPLSRKRKKSA